MGIEPIMILLVGESAGRSSRLFQWLARRSCNCQFATSYRDACDLISRTAFDLVLSQYQLPDRTAFPLLEWLAGSHATLLFSARVEDGFLWLKMLERGRRCVGAPAMRSNALIATLDQVLMNGQAPGYSQGILRPKESFALSESGAYS